MDRQFRSSSNKNNSNANINNLEQGKLLPVNDYNVKIVTEITPDGKIEKRYDIDLPQVIGYVPIPIVPEIYPTSEVDYPPGTTQIIDGVIYQWPEAVVSESFPGMTLPESGNLIDE